MNNNLRKWLKKADEIIYSAMEEEPIKWRGVIGELIRTLETFYEPDRPEPSLCYALGYCWFHMPDDNGRSNDFINAEFWLKKAIDINKNHYYAIYYLTALYFDFKKYSEAKWYASHIPLGYFKNEYDQWWRDLKIAEFLLCCKIYLSPDIVNFDEIKEFMNVLLNDTSNDWSMPDEFIESITFYVKSQKGSIVKKVASEVFLFLEKLDIDDCYTDELEIIMKYAG